MLDNYLSAKDLVTFVDGNEKLRAMVDKPEDNLEQIGQHLLNSGEGEVRVNGSAAGEEQAGMVGYQFLTNFMEARQLVNEIDATEEQTPETLGHLRMRFIEKSVLLQTLDHLWREHLVVLEHLREVVGFRAYGQRDPLNEYKSEAFMLFDGLLTKLREDVTKQLMHINIQGDDTLDDLYGLDEDMDMPNIETHHDQSPLFGDYAKADAALANEQNVMTEAEAASRTAPLRTRQASTDIDPNDPATWGKVSRNALCPCGSGKKYKHCHGRR